MGVRICSVWADAVEHNENRDWHAAERTLHSAGVVVRCAPRSDVTEPGAVATGLGTQWSRLLKLSTAHAEAVGTTAYPGPSHSPTADESSQSNEERRADTRPDDRK